jgi:hypothetical protein
MTEEVKPLQAAPWRASALIPNEAGEKLSFAD